MRKQLFVALIIPIFLSIFFHRLVLTSVQADLSHIEAIVVEEKQEWLFPIVAPLIAKLEQDKIPLLLAISPTSQQSVRKLVSRLGNKNCLMFTTSHSSIYQHLAFQEKKISLFPTQAAIDIAQNFWEKAEEVVIAEVSNAEAMIRGATFAAHRKIPFIPFQEKSPHEKALFDMLKKLNTSHIWLNTPAQVTKWKTKLAKELPENSLSTGVVTDNQIVQSIGKKNILNIILTRTPSKEPQIGKTAWLAPYLSFARKAPVVFSRSEDPKKAEEKVFKFIHRHRIKPRSLTILADYNSIGESEVIIPSKEEEYQVFVEPCVLPTNEKTPALAVGRFPSPFLKETSLLMARSIGRLRLLNQPENRVLMVANPFSDFGELPLAHTISLATAEEFKNWGVPIDEFYQQPSNAPDILSAANKAHLIIYQGHVTDQRIFRSFEDLLYEKLDQENIAFMERDQVPPRIRTELQRKLRRNLQGVPLVVLQSCHSLEEPTAKHIFDSGACGLIGSVTNIHSASGSSFIKAFSDGLLYHNYTLGEALLFARNYFFCLAKLKEKRGHEETAKVNRVALSFRLWGDPELKLGHPSLKSPQKKPVKGKFISQDKILIKTPVNRLPQAKTEQYFTRMPPRSEVAGIVKSIKNKETRRVMLLYFFRLPMSKDFKNQAYSNIQVLANQKEAEGKRSTFMVDAYERYIYVLHFPKKPEKKKEITLQFSK